MNSLKKEKEFQYYQRSFEEQKRIILLEQIQMFLKEKYNVNFSVVLHAQVMQFKIKDKNFIITLVNDDCLMCATTWENDEDMITFVNGQIVKKLVTYVDEMMFADKILNRYLV